MVHMNISVAVRPTMTYLNIIHHLRHILYVGIGLSSGKVLQLVLVSFLWYLLKYIIIKIAMIVSPTFHI